MQAHTQCICMCTHCLHGLTSQIHYCSPVLIDYKDTFYTMICTYHSVYTLSIYIIESVPLFVCLFAVNAKTTARIHTKRSGITKNDPESVLCVLKSPVLVFLGRYRDISGFSFAADRHFYFSHFQFWLLPRRQNVKTLKLRNGLTPNAQELRRTTRRVSYGG